MSISVTDPVHSMTPVAIRRLFFPILLLLAFATDAADHDHVMPPLAPGAFPVACSNLAHDVATMNQIGGLAEDFWNGNPQNGQGRYLSQILAEGQTAIQFDLPVPADSGLYSTFANTSLPLVTLVCYPTSPDNTRPDYSLPNGSLIPRMERPGDLPILPDAAPYPLLVYSHSLGGSPLADNHLSSILRLASHGYIVMAVFHGDARIGSIRIQDLGDLIYLLGHFNRVVELQALRPLALKAALDDLLARPSYSDHVDPERIGAFGTSLGGEAVLLSMGAWLTTNLKLEARPTAQDARIKAAAAYVPYSGLRLLPAFGDNENGAQYVTRPVLAISGTADTTAPLFMTEQAVNQMQGSRFLVALAGVPHQYLPEYGDDVYGWVVPFLDAYVKDDPAALARFAQTQSIAGGLDDSLLVNVTLPPTPQTGLWAVAAEVNGQNGRGFQVETRNGLLVFTYYGYLAGGLDHWYLATGALANGSFTADLTQYQGGTALGAPYTPATVNGSAGTVTMNFTSSTTGSITLPGESAKAISKFAFSGNSSPAVMPSNGLWVINDELNGQNGRGFEIEQHGGLLVFTYYGYKSTGQETWYLAVDAMSGSSFTSTLTEYGGGTVTGGAYSAATEIGSPGQVTIAFTSPATGIIILPGETAKAITKFSW
jgi:dienelactone hydrolase